MEDNNKKMDKTDDSKRKMAFLTEVFATNWGAMINTGMEDNGKIFFTGFRNIDLRNIR